MISVERMGPRFVCPVSLIDSVGGCLFCSAMDGSFHCEYNLLPVKLLLHTHHPVSIPCTSIHSTPNSRNRTESRHRRTLQTLRLRSGIAIVSRGDTT